MCRKPQPEGRAAGVSYTVSVTPVNGFTGDVSLTLSGLPRGQASWSISPPVIAGGSGSAQLTVSTAASIAAGTYPLTITATSGAMAHTAAAALVVAAPPDFTLSSTPASRNVVAGAGASYAVGVASAPQRAICVCCATLGSRSAANIARSSGEVSMNSDLYGELADAGRTALEIVRRQRAGDLRGIVDLIGTYGDDGKWLIFGAMASIVNQALAAFDELAREHGEALRADDLLEAMAVGLQPPGPGPSNG